MDNNDILAGPVRQIPSLEVLDNMNDQSVREVIISSPNIKTVKIESIRIIGPTLVAKHSLNEIAQEESAALTHAHKLGIRVPIVRRIIPEDRTGGSRCDAFIVMDRIHGMTLEQLWPQLGIIDTIRYALQLRKFIGIMRASKSQRGGGLANGTYYSRWIDVLPQPTPGMSPTRFTSYLNWWLKLVMDSRPDRPVSSLNMDSRPDRLVRPLKDHTFVHQDLVPHNLIIDQNRQLWVVDWQWGGYYPEYFEYGQMADPNFGKPVEGSGSWTATYWRWKWDLFRLVATGLRPFKFLKSLELLQVIHEAIMTFTPPSDNEY